MANCSLSYVAALADVCARDNLEPEYDLVKVEGPCHDPIFVMRGHVGKYEAIGRGSKKQTAKQHAAKQILLEMGEVKAEDLEAVESKVGFESAKVIGNVVDGFVNPHRTGPGAIPIEGKKDRKRNIFTPVPEANQINPLGDLIEISLLMGWPQPTVADEQKAGPAHDPRFTVSCYFSKYKTFATAKSKKEAKRLAALEMHEHMRYIPEIMYKYSLRTGRPLDPSAMCNQTVEPMETGAFACPSDFTFSGVPKMLEMSQSHTLEILRGMKSVDEMADPEDILLKIMKESQFTMEFVYLCEDLYSRPVESVDVDGNPSENEKFKLLAIPFPKPGIPCEEESDDELELDIPNSSKEKPKASREIYTVYCVLKLPVSSPIRLLGYGSTPETARYNAAKKALQYMQLMALKDPL